MRGKTFVLTEYVEPVSRIMSSLESEELVCGMSDILKALDFLHQRCRLSHNNVSPKSLFLSRKSLCWKLGCTQLMSSADEETFDFVKRMIVYKQLNSTHNFLPPEDLTPEICQPIPSVKEIHRRDSFAAGSLIQTLLPHLKDSQMVKQLTSGQKDLRPELGPLLTTEPLFTECAFLSLKESLVSFGSFSEEEKKNFVTVQVIEMMRYISPKLLASTVIPMMLTNRLLMLHPESRNVLHPHLFVPSDKPCAPISEPLISRPLFERYVIPIIIKLFSVRKIKLRLILLQYLPFYAALIQRSVMCNTVTPLISLGLEDENDDILSATYAALATLVQVFGGDMLQEGKKKRRKVFSNDVPRSSSLSSSSHAVSGSLRDRVTFRPCDARNGMHHEVEREERHASVREEGWTGEWGSSPSSSPTSVAHIHAHCNANVEISGNGRLDSATNVISNVDEEKSIKSWKKRTGVQELDIKAIEIQVPEEVEDLFSEMEPRVKFAARTAAEQCKFRVNSHPGELGSTMDLFALKDELERDGDEGDWSNDDHDEWVEEQQQPDLSPPRPTLPINELSGPDLQPFS